MPSATVLEYCSGDVDLQPALLERLLGLGGALAGPAADRDRAAPLRDHEVDDRSEPQRAPGLGVGGDDDALGDGLGERLGGLAERHVGVEDPVLRLVHGDPGQLRELPDRATQRVNPPWTLHDELKVLLPALAAVMSRGPAGAVTLDWLTGESAS